MEMIIIRISIASRVVRCSLYVCLCNPITENQVRRCVREGARTLSDLQACLGVAANCGSCAAVAVSIVEEECARFGAACTMAGNVLPAAA